MNKIQSLRNWTVIFFPLVLFLTVEAQSQKVPGTLLAYLPAQSQKYIGSQCIRVLANEDYLTSHDLFVPEEELKITIDHKSKNKGDRWEKISLIEGQFWSNLFLGINLNPLCLWAQDPRKQVISKAFELRFVSQKPEANGETDFKGETTVFDTEQRMAFLRHWADYGRAFFNDPELNTKVVKNTEVEAALEALKPQPLPQIRKTISLNNWKYLGYREGQQQQELEQMELWNSMEGVTLENGKLVLENNTLTKKFPNQPWRMKASWKAQGPESGQHITFGLAENVKAGFIDGQFFYISNGEMIHKGSYEPGRFYNFETELDLSTGNGRYNLYVDGNLLADFVPLSPRLNGRSPGKTDCFTINSGDGKLLLDALHIISYGPQPSPMGSEKVREVPFLIETLLDEDFIVRPSPEGFEKLTYDDSEWAQIPYERYAHGGERHKGEVLYLRKKMHVGDFERAVLDIETVRPAGKLYINGEKAADLTRHPARMDISDRLVPGRENIIAVKVDPHQVEKPQYHMSVDTWSGWFAGLMNIELTAKNRIRNVFAYATEMGRQATLCVEVKTDPGNEKTFRGKLITRVYPWFPEESGIPAGESVVPIPDGANQTEIIKSIINISKPKPWTAKTPNLYKVRVILQDEKGEDIDDWVLTTGLRTIDQSGGTFRINGQPEMLLGPLLFGHHYPMERITQWMFSPPKERWIHDILLTKRMNGNTIRMSVHDARFGGVNDRRLAEIGDQMGIMFIWQTPAWIREGVTDGFDFDGLPLYAKAVRNHPSIVVWQPGNHPRYTLDWFQRVHDSLATVDQTRLISPSGDITHWQGEFEKTIGETGLPADADQSYHVWTSPLLGRGTMERVLGYGQEWSSLRNFPGMHTFHGIELEARMEYLNSKTHGWFDYESEETIGQPNWEMERGKPYYKMFSYESNYDQGSIGRILTFDEWKESQAWQALSAYESYRKKRWLGFDGMNWCPLRGGGNSATYMKPVVGYQNHVKLGYYALQMVFQPVLAGSKNIDIAYGPDDKVPVIVINLGEAKMVDVMVRVKTMDGKTVAEKHYSKVRLPAGREVVNLGEWRPGLLKEGHYAFEYFVLE